MTKRIHISGPTLERIEDIGPTLPRIDAARVAEGLGAEDSDVHLEGALAPVTLFAVREELLKRLQSSGGRPALAGATRRAKIPLSDKEWLQLEELAAAVSSPGFAPSAGQVASVLLTLAVQFVAGRISRANSSPIRRELAERLATESDEG